MGQPAPNPADAPNGPPVGEPQHAPMGKPIEPDTAMPAPDPLVSTPILQEGEEKND